MALGPGSTLGSYEIVAPLGRGGMGEVWRARDSKLGREVALKTLPPEFAADPDRLARFRREAQLLASLNHPNIGAIHGLEEADGETALVLELVEGETLADRLRGPLPPREALGLAFQICGALEAAHDKGVVHRDLKPANIKITPEGAVKVLDFGLAKAFEGPASANPALTNSPTLSMAATQAGVILGTAGYMSPEQASGGASDKRADIWSFGVVLFEMLTGKPVFGGETVPHVLAAVLAKDPPWERLPANLHPRLRELLERCLAKTVGPVPGHWRRAGGLAARACRPGWGSRAAYLNHARGHDRSTGGVVGGGRRHRRCRPHGACRLDALAGRRGGPRRAVLVPPGRRRDRRARLRADGRHLAGRDPDRVRSWWRALCQGHRRR